MNVVKVAIIGIGNMGSAHLNCIYNGEIKGLRVTAVCDSDTARLERLKEMYPGLQYYTAFPDLLEHCGADAVIIATPHRLHAEIAMQAFAHRMHVLSEKPADIALSRVKKMNDAAAASGKVFGIMFNQRTNSLFAKAREIVRGGELGALKRSVFLVTNWYRTQHYYDSGDWRATWAGEGGGVLLNQAPHNLDLWQWICGMPQSITAFCDTAKYHTIEVEDDVTIYAKYPNGATGVFLTSTGEYPGTNRLEISGTRGKLVLENGILKFWKLKRDEREVCFQANENFTGIESDYAEYRQTEPESAHRGILQNFTNAILSGEKLLAPGADGIYELSISNAAYLSEWQNHKEIPLPPDADEFDRLLAEKIKNSGFKTKPEEEIQKHSYAPRWQVKW